MILRTIFTILYVLLIITTVIMIIIDSGDSGKKFAWLLVIAFLPAVGLILYYMFGINYRHHWIFQRRHQRFTDAFNEGATEEIKNLLFGHEAEKMLRPEYIAMTRLVGQNSYPTLTDGNDIEIISWGHRKFELLCVNPHGIFPFRERRQQQMHKGAAHGQGKGGGEGEIHP